MLYYKIVSNKTPCVSNKNRYTIHYLLMRNMISYTKRIINTIITKFNKFDL